MAEREKWKWQEPGTTWKGVGLYHITLTIPDRQPLLGSLVIPGNDPTMAKVIRSPLGNALVNCLLSIPHFHPEVQVLHFCLMPDHLHAVIYVRRTMPKGIGALVRGFWQAAKKLGRASLIVPQDMQASLIVPNGMLASSIVPNGMQASLIVPNDIRGKLQEGTAQGNLQESATMQEATAQLEAHSAKLREEMGDEAYYRLAPVFTEKPFIRPMGHNTQLPTTIRYIDMNPQRLATKRLKPGFFRVQREITIGSRSYDGVGNATLLSGERFSTVHVRSVWVEAAIHGHPDSLRNYMNSCVLMARKGVIMVSPFISPHEKQVMQVLLNEQHPFIVLASNGFREYYKPSDLLFDACAAGRVLILSPWPYDTEKKHISRADCMALNAMAEEICNLLNTSDTQ